VQKYVKRVTVVLENAENEVLVAKIGVDTEENESPKVSRHFFFFFNPPN